MILAARIKTPRPTSEVDETVIYLHGSEMTTRLLRCYIRRIMNTYNKKVLLLVLVFKGRLKHDLDLLIKNPYQSLPEKNRFTRILSFGSHSWRNLVLLLPQPPKKFLRLFPKIK